MNAIQSHPPQQVVTTTVTATTLTIDLAELPQLGLARRLALRICLALIVRAGHPATRETVRRGRLEWLARSERERLAERLLLSTIPRR
jgi:hypothetical protein